LRSRYVLLGGEKEAIDAGGDHPSPDALDTATIRRRRELADP
jgi:hypothetical protein